MSQDAGVDTHVKTTHHMTRLIDALHREEAGEDIDWAQLGAAAPYCGCTSCDVREALTYGISDLVDKGVLAWAHHRT